MLTSHLNDNTKNTPSSKSRHAITKLVIATLLMLTMVGITLHANTQTTHAATASSYEINTINQVFGPYASQAIRIAQCESSMNPNARNTEAVGGSYATGLFQILYPSTWNGTSEAGQSPYNVLANTKAAYEIFKSSGYTWSQWQCQP